MAQITHEEINNMIEQKSQENCVGCINGYNSQKDHPCIWDSFQTKVGKYYKEVYDRLKFMKLEEIAMKKRDPKKPPCTG